MILGDMFDVSVGGTAFLAIISFIISLIIFILWIVIGWRAMKAHEKIADKLEQITVAQQNTALPLPPNQLHRRTSANWTWSKTSSTATF